MPLLVRRQGVLAREPTGARATPTSTTFTSVEHTTNPLTFLASRALTDIAETIMNKGILAMAALVATASLVKATSPAELQQAITASITRGDDLFTVPAEIFAFTTQLVVQGAEDWRLDASGSEFVFPCGLGLLYHDCHNVSTTGITIDYVPKCYAQGSVVGWAAGTTKPMSNATVDMELEEGFPVPMPHVNRIFSQPVVKVIFWDGSSRLMSTWQTGVNNWLGVKQLSATRFRAILDPTGDVPPSGSASGLLVTFGPRLGLTHSAINCSLMRFEGTRIYGGGNMIYTEFGGLGGNVYRNVSITRRPGTAGLMSGNADAFHSSCVGGGPEVTESELAFTGDDIMNVHNKIGLVWLAGCDSPTPAGSVCVDVIDTSGTNTLNLLNARAGDTMTVYDLQTEARVGEWSLVTDAQPETNASIITAANAAPQLITEPPYSAHIRDFTVYVVRLVVSTVQLSANSTRRFQLVQFDRFSGAGANIHDNYFHDSFDTACKLKAINSTYSRNRVERARGVHVAAEEFWLEGSLGLRNVSVTSNTFVDCGTTNTSVVNKGPDASDIHIENNTIILGPV